MRNFNKSTKCEWNLFDKTYMISFSTEFSVKYYNTCTKSIERNLHQSILSHESVINKSMAYVQAFLIKKKIYTSVITATRILLICGDSKNRRSELQSWVVQFLQNVPYKICNSIFANALIRVAKARFPMMCNLASDIIVTKIVFTSTRYGRDECVSELLFFHWNCFHHFFLSPHSLFPFAFLWKRHKDVYFLSPELLKLFILFFNFVLGWILFLFRFYCISR